MKLGVRHPGPVRGIARDAVAGPVVLPARAGVGVVRGLDIDALLDVLADRLAEKVRARLAHDGGGVAVGPRLLTVEQGAAYLGRTKEAVQHLIASGRVPTVRTDRRVFLDVRDLDRWIDDCKQAAV